MNANRNISNQPKAAIQAAKVSQVFFMKSETNRNRLRIIKKEAEMKPNNHPDIKKGEPKALPPAQRSNE